MRAKKLIILYAVVLFLVVFAVTFNCVCAIARFDVKFEVSSMTEEAQRVQARLEEEYGGKSYLFFGQEDVEAIVLEEGGGYLTVESFSKTFPNVIHAEVREKLEVLSVKVGDKYYAIDKDNTVLAINDAPVNNVSGNNPALYGISLDPDNPAQVGDKLTVAADDEAAFAAVRSAYDTMDEMLGGARVNVSAIRFNREFEGMVHGGTSLYIEMREGVCIWIMNCMEDTEAKVKTAMRAYLGLEEVTWGADEDDNPLPPRLLTDAERMYGYLTVLNASEPADYSTKPPQFTVE